MNYRVTRSFRRLGRDERGAVLIYVSLMLPVLVGLGVLAVDAARLGNLATSLQKGADALALAGAAELDRKPDAITRANAAIANMVDNQHKFAIASPATVNPASIRYLKSLPANDVSNIDSSHVTTDPALARFVEVTVTTQTLNTVLPASFIGGSDTATATARAVAGFDAAVCQFTPMFICNPYEGTGISIWQAIADPANRRRQIKMQLGPGGTSQYFPGNYGWLDSPMLGNGANALQEALASVKPRTCFVQNGVSQKTGNITPADSAINTRFDMYDQGFQKENGNPDYPPAMNVRKGYAVGANACKRAPPKDATNVLYPNENMLGRDSAFPQAGGRLGNGQWDFETYWTKTFGTGFPSGWSNANLPSRYEVYRYEIDNGQVGTAAVSGAAAGETGSPACYSGGALSDDPDRRIIYGAIIDCAKLSVHGNSGGPLPVTAFGKFFLTEPVCPDNNWNCGGRGTIWAELIGVVEPGNSNSIAHDLVQLYR